MRWYTLRGITGECSPGGGEVKESGYHKLITGKELSGMIRGGSCMRAILQTSMFLKGKGANFTLMARW